MMTWTFTKRFIRHHKCSRNKKTTNKWIYTPYDFYSRTGGAFPKKKKSVCIPRNGLLYNSILDPNNRSWLYSEVVSVSLVLLKIPVQKVLDGWHLKQKFVDVKYCWLINLALSSASTFSWFHSIGVCVCAFVCVLTSAYILYICMGNCNFN